MILFFKAFNLWWPVFSHKCDDPHKNLCTIVHLVSLSKKKERKRRKQRKKAMGKKIIDVCKNLKREN